MSFDIPEIHFPDNSQEAQVMEAIMRREHLTAEEIVRMAIRMLGLVAKRPIRQGKLLAFYR